MKRFNVILIALVLFGGAFVSAQEYAPTVSISGEVDLKFSFDLEKGIIDLENEITTDLVIEFVAEGNTMKTQDSGVYGVIKLENFGFKIDSDDIQKFADGEITLFADGVGSGAAFVDIDGDGEFDEEDDDFYILTESLIKEPDVTAHIYLAGPLFYITVTNVDITTNFAPTIALGTIKDGGGTEKPLELEFDGEEEGSVTIGTENGIVDASLVLGDNDGDDSDNDDMGSFDIFAKASLKAIDGLILEAGLGIDDLSADSSTLGFGGKVGYAFGDMMAPPLSISVAFDGKVENDEVKPEIGAALDLAILGGTVGVDFATSLDDHALLVEASTGDLLPFLVADTAFELGVVGGDTQIGLKGGLKFPLGGGIVEPYALMRLALLGDDTKFEGDIGVKLRVIENVVF